MCFDEYQYFTNVTEYPHIFLRVRTMKSERYLLKQNLNILFITFSKKKSVETHQN